VGSFPLASETLETLSKVAQHIFLGGDDGPRSGIYCPSSAGSKSK
jgi:hypothetical protein